MIKPTSQHEEEGVGGDRGSTEFGSSPGVLQMCELANENLRVVGRNEEHQNLLEYFQDKNTKMVTVVGPSGLGKSVVAQQLQETIVKKGGVVCCGKFDVQNRADPYQAFVEAIKSFVSQLLYNKAGNLGLC